MKLGERFEIGPRGSTVRTEVLGGATTFVTMAYIIVVNPAILAFAGLPVGPSTVATVVVAAFGSALMGLYANRPIAVAPYMGENAFIAFGLAAMGIGWQQRLGAVFLSGILFLLITVLGRPALARRVDLAEPQAQLRGGDRSLPRPHRALRERASSPASSPGCRRRACSRPAARSCARRTCR